MYKFLVIYFYGKERFEKIVNADDHMKAIKNLRVDRDYVFDIRLVR